MARRIRRRGPHAHDAGRRVFLKRAGAAGSALVAVPSLLGGCGVVPALEGLSPAPAEPLADWLALDDSDLSTVLAVLGARGGDFGEVFFQSARRTRLVLEDGRLEPALADSEQGAGLRVVDGERSGFASAEALTMTALTAAAREAAARGPGPALAVPGDVERRMAAGVYPVTLPWPDVAIADKRSVMTRVEERARAADPAIDGVRVEWRDSDERILIASLDGRVVEDRRPLTSLSVQVRATRNGVSHSGFASMSARAGLAWYDDARVDELAATAAARALLRFEARRPPAGELPVILAAGTGAILLHEAIGHALEADLAAGEPGLFDGCLGERVGSAAVTLIDDATIAQARGALGVDDEGSDTGPTVLIEGGVLRGYLQDRRSAQRLSAASTGSARRQSFRHPPLPRMSCTYLADGPHTAEELLADVRLGLLAETFAGGRADPASGDFTFTVQHGWLIENGARTMPVRDVPLSGNGRTLLSGIERVAGDGRLGTDAWTCGKQGQRVPVSLGMPTARVAGLTIGAPKPT